MILLNPTVLALGAVAFILFYLWRCWTSPLASLPGPKISAISSWALKYHEFRAERTNYIHDLHLKYGQVVRIAPNEVSFASLDGVKEIYSSGGSGYDKTDFYDLFLVFGRRTMFSTLNKHDHAKRKRIIADRYANSNILKPESLQGIRASSQSFALKCAESIGQSLDVFIYLHAFAFDSATNHLFYPYGSKSLTYPEHRAIMEQVTFDDSIQNRLINYYCPLLHRLMGSVLSIFIKPRETPLADDFVLSANAKTDVARFTLLHRMQDKAHGLQSIDMAAECLDHMVAGIDTTGDALCFLMWEISQPRSFHIQKRLQDELRKNPDVSVENLPFLDTVVLEGLRCFPAIPMSLPRRVPPGGRVIDGYFIPEHTIVSSQAYSTHRVNQEVFPQPDLFNPDRWAAVEGELDRKRLFFAFSSGGRGCIGKHLALAEMKILLREVYSKFTTLPDERMRPEDMEFAHQLISSQPRGKKCQLKFSRIEE